METVEILKELISFNTSNPMGNEAIVADWIGDYLKEFGFDIVKPSCGENRKSIVAKYKFGDNGPKLLLNGHIDVVPVGNGWETNPFEAVEKDGRIYGRGAADMKGGVAAMIGAATDVLKNADRLKGELVLAFVADEEITNLGTLSCKEQWIDSDYVVIGEPTELNIEIAHLGTARFNIDIYGRSCHSGMPWNGINAVTKSVKVINKINELNDSLDNIRHETVGRPYVSITMMQAWEKDNIIPGKCRISVDYRMIPGENGDIAKSKIEKILSEIASDDKEFKYELNRYINLEPGEIKRNHDFVKFFEDIYEKEFGCKTEVKAFPATCEQVIFSREGIPTLVFGPGSIEQAHIKNEYVEIDQIYSAEKIYKSVIYNLLTKDK